MSGDHGAPRVGFDGIYRCGSGLARLQYREQERMQEHVVPASAWLRGLT